MSYFRLVLRVIGNVDRTNFQNVILKRNFFKTSVSFNEQLEQADVSESQIEESENKKEIPPESDRSKVVPVETSIKYLESDAYTQTYGQDPVWKNYRRNFKGQFIPRKTRRTCIRQGFLATSNPCPICRDEYLILDHRNTKLIQQFISPYNGEILNTIKTGLCQVKHNELLVAIIRAKDYGTISFDVPFRKYNYSEWYNFPTEFTNK